MCVYYRSTHLGCNEACEKYNITVNRVFQMSPLSSVSQDTHKLDETCTVISSPGPTPRSVSSVMFLKSLQREALRERPNLSSLEDRDTL